MENTKNKHFMNIQIVSQKTVFSITDKDSQYYSLPIHMKTM